MKNSLPFSVFLILSPPACVLGAGSVAGNPCSSDADCTRDLAYCASGECLSMQKCHTDADCRNPSNLFSYIAVQGFLSCVDQECAIIEGSSCPDGSDFVSCFAQPCAATSCSEAIACVDDYCGGCNTIFFDAAGSRVCDSSCSSDEDCEDDEYCTRTGSCLPQGECEDVDDCLNPSNTYFSIQCVGTNVCDEAGQCGRICSESPRTTDQDQLDNAMAMWKSLDSSDYDFVFKANCFCEPDYVQNMRVQVKEGVVTQVTTQFGEPVTESVANSVLTIGELFALIQSAIDQQAPQIDVTYNKLMGYPESFLIVTTPGIADAEKSYEIGHVMLYSEVQAELAKRLNQWTKNLFESYSFEFTRMCFCVDAGKPYQISVSNGQVSQVEPIDGGATLSSFPTIEQVFGNIQDAIDSRAFDIVVEYDLTHGNPMDVYIDYEEMMADEEYRVQVEFGSGQQVPGQPVLDEVEELLETSSGIDNRNWLLLSLCCLIGAVAHH